ncbi:MAG: response regulator transcription factor [Chloroflexota bacterium]|nr:response regulator transcription factor [Chloroflexota bacterium]
MRILVIEDDEAIAELVHLALTDRGHIVTVAPNGLVGLDAVATGQPDLILLDMLMPKLDGWGFATVYRKRPPPHAPVVVMTAAADATRRSEEIRAQGVLPKPFGLDELFAVVDSFDT